MKKSFFLAWSFLIFILFLFLFISYFIKIPNTIEGEGILTNHNVIDYISSSEGIIEYIPEDNEKIKKGETIFLLKTIALKNVIDSLEENITPPPLNFKNLLELKRNIESINIEKLGEISLPYTKFYSQLNMYIKYHKTNYASTEVDIKKNELSTVKNSIQNYINILSNDKRRLALMKDIIISDSILFLKRLITKQQWGNTKFTFINAKKDYIKTLKELNTLEKKQSILFSELQKAKLNIELKEVELINSTMEKYVSLVNAINDWKNRNVIISQSNGTIKYYKFWKKHDLIHKDEFIFAFVMKENTRNIEIKINIDGAGKIKVGQECLIELKEFPSKDYGILKGKVLEIISLKHLEKNKHYSTYIKIEIINNGLTNYGNTLVTRHSMPVKAEIILENERLFDKIFKRIKKISPSY